MQFQPITCSTIELFDVLARIRARGGFPDNVETGVGGKNGQYRVSFLECVSVQVRTGDVNAMDTVASAGKRKAAALTNSKRVVPAIASAAVISAETANVLVAPTGPRHLPYQGKAPASLLATDAVKCAVAPRNPSNGPKIPCHGPATAMESCPAIGAETVGMVSDFVMRQDRSDATQTSTRHVSEGGKCPTQVSTGNQPGTGLAHPPHNDSKLSVLVPGDAKAIAQEGTRTQSVEHTSRCHGIACGTLAADNSISIESRLLALQSKLAAEGRLKRSKTAPKEARLPHSND